MSDNANRVIGVFLFVFAVLIGGGVAQGGSNLSSTAVSIDPGFTEGNVYTNKTLALKIKYPTRMVADSREELDKASDEGVQVYKDWGGKEPKTAEALAKRERSVFGISTPENDKTIASLTLSVAKDVTGGELEPMVARTLKILTAAPNVTLAKPVKPVEMAGLTFYSFELSVVDSGVIIRSTMYATRRNGYLLSFSITHLDDTGREVMLKVLNDIELI